jgi:outer membrane protein assembly factor BamB
MAGPNMRPTTPWLLIPLLALFMQGVAAQSPLLSVYVSSDIDTRTYVDDAEIGTWVGTDKHLFIWKASSDNDQEAPFFDEPATEGMDIVGYHREPRLYVIDTATNLGGTLVRASDVASDGGVLSDPTILFDGRANALPAGVNIDAVTIDPDTGDLVLSFDRSVGASPLFRRADLVRWNGSVYQHYFQGTMLPVAADINGAHILDSGNILMTFESGIMVPGSGGSFYVRDDQVVEFDPDTGLFVLQSAVDLNTHPAWRRAGFDALAAIEGGDFIFADRFED